MISWILLSSIFIVIFLIIRGIWGKKINPHVMYFLWIFVAVRLLVPSYIPVETSVMPVTSYVVSMEQAVLNKIGKEDVELPPLVQNQVESLLNGRGELKALSKEGTFEDDTLYGLSKSSYHYYFDDSIPEEELAINNPITRKSVFDLLDVIYTPSAIYDVLKYFWVAGIGIMALGFAVKNISWRKHVKRSRKLCEDIECELPVYYVSWLPSSCMVGIIKPKIYINDDYYEQKDGRYVLLHELTHYKHKDAIWTLVRCACLCVHWFNPLVWISFILCVRDCECSCDASVSRQMDITERAAYGQLLLNLSVEKKDIEHIFLPTTYMSLGGNSLKKRIKIILKKYKQHIATTVVVSMVTILLCTSVVFAKETYNTPIQQLLPVEEELKTIEPKGWNVSEGVFITPDIENIQFADGWQIEDCYITNKTLVTNHFLIDRENRLFGKGWSDFGLLGEDWISDYKESSIVIAENVVHMDTSVNCYFIAWLTEDGKLYAQGKNIFGMLGGNQEEQEFYWSPQLLMEDVAYFQAGQESIVVLKENGDVYWWGRIVNYNSSNEEMLYDTPQLMLQNARYVAAGNNTFAAITKDDALYMWGENRWGECGTKIGGAILEEPTKVHDNVQMVWPKHLMYNYDFLFGVDGTTIYQYDYCNTFILTTDGRYMACGKFIGDEKRTNYVALETDDKETHNYSAEFLPITIVEDPFVE